MREMRTLRYRSNRHVVQLPPDIWAKLDSCSRRGRLTGYEGLKVLQDRKKGEGLVACLKRHAIEWPEQIRIAKEAKQAALDARPDWIKERDRKEADASRILGLELDFQLGLDSSGLFKSELDKACRVKSVQPNYLKLARMIDAARQERELNELLKQSEHFDFELTKAPTKSLAMQIKKLEALF